jgi:hypothetical protein
MPPTAKQYDRMLCDVGKPEWSTSHTLYEDVILQIQVAERYTHNEYYEVANREDVIVAKQGVCNGGVSVAADTPAELAVVNAVSQRVSHTIATMTPETAHGRVE